MGEWRLGPVSKAPAHSSLLGRVTHTVLFLDQLHQLMKDFFQSPVGSRGQSRRGGDRGLAIRGGEAGAEVIRQATMTDGCQEQGL